MGHSNLLPLAWVRDAAPELLSALPADAGAADEACVRPERVGLARAADADARITHLSFLGSLRRLRVAWRGRELLAELPASGEAFAMGDAVAVRIDPADCAWVKA